MLVSVLLLLVAVAVFNVDVVSASDDKSGDSSSSFYQFVPPLPVFELFLCSRQVAAAENDVVDYTSMLHVMLYLLPSMDWVLLLLRILCLFMTPLPSFALSLLVLVFVDDNDYADEYNNSSGVLLLFHSPSDSSSSSFYIRPAATTISVALV